MGLTLLRELEAGHLNSSTSHNHGRIHPAEETRQIRQEFARYRTEMKALNYRSSCDRCQDMKVKCGQLKPSCQRCAKQGLRCVYSPLRTIGRPKKRPLSGAAKTGRQPRAGTAPTEARPDQSPRDALPSPPTTSRLLNNGAERLGDTRATASRPGDDPGSGLVLCGVDPAPPCGAENRDMGNHQPSPGAPVTCAPEDLYTDMAGIQFGTWPFSSTAMATPTVNDYSYPNTSSLETPNKQRPPDVSDVFDVFDVSPNSSADCYVGLLDHLAQAERCLASIPPENPAPVDFMLGATKDLLGLKQRIFSCEGHGALGSAEAGACRTPPCLSSARPVLLILCVFTGRVVHLFEKLFQRAPDLTQPSAVEEAAPPRQEEPYSTNWRRSLRAVRSVLDISSTCQFPDANRPLQIGAMEVSHEVKTRALRRILRRRMQMLLVMLEDMKGITGSKQMEEDGLQSLTPTSMVGPEATCDVKTEASRESVVELYLRVETLLGRVDLTN